MMRRFLVTGDVLDGSLIGVDGVTFVAHQATYIDDDIKGRPAYRAEDGEIVDAAVVREELPFDQMQEVILSLYIVE